MEENIKTVQTQDEGKTIAIIAYLTIIGLVIAFVMNNDKKHPFATYHIKQSLGLAAVSLVLWVIGLIPFIGWIISIIGFFVILYMWIMGLVNAVNQRQKPLPFLGNKFEKWFKNI